MVVKDNCFRLQVDNSFFYVGFSGDGGFGGDVGDDYGCEGQLHQDAGGVSGFSGY